MRPRPLHAARLAPFLILLAGPPAAAQDPPASPPRPPARTYDLEQLLDLARRHNHGLAAGAQVTKKVEAQLTEANRSWWPTGELFSLLALVPNIECDYIRDPDPDKMKRYCVGTNVYEATTNFRFGGIFTRTDLRITQPLYTFGKISAGREAATHGVAAARSQERGVAAELELNVRRAYWGIKLAREILDTFDEGTSYLDEAQKRIEDNLAKGTGESTQTDRLRFRTVRAEIDARRLETEKLAGDARAGLRALLGSGAPAELEIDAEPLLPLEIPERKLAHYQEEARKHRPELQALEKLAAAKRSLADLEFNRFFPDLFLMASASYARAPSVDNPPNAFYNDPFNGSGVGFAAGLRLPLDLGIRSARHSQVAAEAEETEHRRREAVAGVDFEVARAFGGLEEARKRFATVRGGERAAKAWINALSANMAAGLAEPKDFQDALTAFFSFRVRVLQATYDLNFAAATLARVTGVEVAAPPKKKDAGE